MGAAHWEATIHTPQGDTRFDFHKMNTDARRRWYRMFMDSVRAVYGKGDEGPPRRRRYRPRKKAGGRR